MLDWKLIKFFNLGHKNGVTKILVTSLQRKDKNSFFREHLSYCIDYLQADNLNKAKMMIMNITLSEEGRKFYLLVTNNSSEKDELPALLKFYFANYPKILQSIENKIPDSFIDDMFFPSNRKKRSAKTSKASNKTIPKRLKPSTSNNLETFWASQPSEIRDLTTINDKKEKTPESPRLRFYNYFVSS